MSFNTCCVPGCRVDLDEGVLHKFPNPKEDHERFQRWVSNIGAPIQELADEFIYRNRRVCRRHFEKVYQYPKNRLCKLAVPTICMPVLSQERQYIHTSNQQPACSSSALRDITNLGLTGVQETIDVGRNQSMPMDSVSTKQLGAQETIDAGHNQSMPMDIVSTRQLGVQETIDVGHNQSVPVDIVSTKQLGAQETIDAGHNQSMPMDIVSIKQRATTSTADTHFAPHKQGRKTTKQEVELIKTILKLKANLQRSKNLHMSYKKRLSMAKKAVKTKAFEVLSQKMTKATKTFLKMQVTQVGKKCKGRRFTLNEKILALSLYKTSPKSYRLLSEICILPKRKTIQNILQKLNLQPGINTVMMKQLKKKVSKLPEKYKHCTVIFDEMAIAPSLAFDKKNDKIMGFVEDGENRKENIADHVLVFMVRGVVKKFKQPIAYSFCSGSTKTQDLKRMIKNVIKEVEKTGLNVVATICDQGATNVAAINSLINDTKAQYLKEKNEWRGGFFEIDEKKIFPLYDPPHLMKGVRNNLINKKLLYKSNGKDLVAQWEHLIALYERGPGYKGVRLVNKLTAHHVMPKLIPKMRVKHCTQVFSRSVGVALGFMADEGKLPPESKGTADLLIFFDNLFDSVNGSFHKVQNGKVYRSAVTPTSPHHRLWRESLPTLQTMHFVDAKGKKANVPSLVSWIKTIEGFQQICKYMHSLGVNSLLLRHFNQDPLENFFGAIRAHGYSNVMPTAAAFQAAYKTLLVNNMVSAHSVGANCEKDESSCLQSLKYLFKQKIDEITLPDLVQGTEISAKHLLIEPINTNELLVAESHVGRERCAAIGYCSGWLIKVAKQKIYKSCAECKNALESKEIENFHKFILIKDYNEKGWLCYPKREIFDNFCQIENVVNEVLKTTSHYRNLFQYIKTISLIHVRWDFITCEMHKDALTKYLCNKNILFCINNWCKEVNDILSGKTLLWDKDDPIKAQAYKHYEKNKLRKRRST